MAKPGEVSEIESPETGEAWARENETPMQTIAAPPEEAPRTPVDQAATDGVERLPRFFENDAYAWDIRRVPMTTIIHNKEKPHPARHVAVFVVHGMGEQRWTETASNLRSRSEDTLGKIREWEKENNCLADAIPDKEVAPPLVLDGYWADYADLRKTFREDWKVFNKRERAFFSHLWKVRTYGLLRTYFWLLKQQGQLVRFKVGREVGWSAWLLYLPLQFLGFVAWTLAWLRKPKILTGVLADVRIYAEPQGIVEKAIVQRIDKRVGDAFLQLIGLDEDFRPIADDKKKLQASGRPFVSNRVVWVAHSLGTVISYNVLSDLFARAEELSKTGTEDQMRGVELFRTSLRRFVTLGSPLDKFAYLFEHSLRPWPTKKEKERSQLLDESGDDEFSEDAVDGKLRSWLGGLLGGTGSEHPAKRVSRGREWWINFYAVLDPVSGALGHAAKSRTKFYGGKAPLNVHIKGWRAWVPGWAHQAYWSEPEVHRYVLSRVYGNENLPDQAFQRSSSRTVGSKAVGYVVWGFLLYGAVFGGGAALAWYWKPISSFVWKILWTWIKGHLGLGGS